MSLESKGEGAVEQPAETSYERQKSSKITYTKEFLLSFSELDICKKLPNGFDQSLLSEFEDTSQDRQKGPVSLSMHNFRRNEYGSSPPIRGESGNYSRGIHGRWDSRSSGRSDKDSDSQSEWDSDSGRRYGSQSRRSWQNPEHDGLLGSGSLARPSGYAAGASAPKFRANDHYQLNRSNEPYQPPRPYKAVPHGRREANDSFNDETFGSSEFTSEDRAEEERKRRASFELMRKEQQKAFQEKQKLNLNKPKDDFDITTLIEDSKDDERDTIKSNQLEEPGSLPVPGNESEKSVLPTQTPAPRPLVPPGFASAALERNIGAKNVAHSHSIEVGNSELEGGILQGKGKRLLNGTFNNQENKPTEQAGLLHEHESSNVHVSHNNESNAFQKLTTALDVPMRDKLADGRLYNTPSLSKAYEAASEIEGIELDGEKVTSDIIQGKTKADQSSSILNKLFGTVSTSNDIASTNIIEHHDSKSEDTLRPTAAQSSKFAHWFLEEEKKPAGNISSDRPNNLLSLIIGGEKGGSQVSDVTAAGLFPSQIPELGDGHPTPNTACTLIENDQHLSKGNNIKKPAEKSPVLTCEDLEQSILSEIVENDMPSSATVPRWSIDAKPGTKKGIDDHASQHLLSLLTKPTDLKDMTLSASIDIRPSEITPDAQAAKIGSVRQDSRDTNAENVSNPRKNLTLEALFGTAFMKELQSVGAPASSQVGSADNASQLHDGLISPRVEIGSSSSYETSTLTLNHREKLRTDNLKEHFFGFDNSRTELDSSQLRSELGLKRGGFDGSAEMGLPEEDVLITHCDPMKHVMNTSHAELFSNHSAPVAIPEKLATQKSLFGDERPILAAHEGPPFRHGSLDVRAADSPFHNIHIQPASAHLNHPPQLNHVGQLFNPLDSRPAGIHHDPPPTHQFPGSMLRPPFHQPSSGLTGFDPPSHHHPMFQQMHMPGNFPPHHLLRGFPNGPHSNSHMSGFMQDGNSMPGLPFGHMQPNLSGLGIRPHGPDAGGASNNPEALQRLFEMEVRTNSKHILPPFAGGGPNQGMYNQELDMGSSMFR